MTFNIQTYKDGVPSNFTNWSGLDIDEAIEELIYYNVVTELYSVDELKTLLLSIKPNNHIFIGSSFFQFKITKK